MILKTEVLKDVSAKILSAVDPDGYSIVTETLGLSVKDKYMKLAVTNREYYVEVRVPVETDEEMTVSVNAVVFLKLMSQITTETVEFEVSGNTLKVTANGSYSIPVMYENENPVSIPVINIGTEVNSFNISADILLSILNYNSKELTKLKSYPRQAQGYYYVDNEGAITFTTGACVNNFTLDGNITMLLSQKVVKLFRLFNENETVRFTFGVDNNNGMSQNKASFVTDSITLSTLLLSDEKVINSVPVQAIRGRANNSYNYSANINRDNLLKMINRIMTMYNPNMGYYSKVIFDKNKVTVIGNSDSCSESLFYNNDINNLDGEYECVLDLKDLKLTLDGCPETFLTISFGDSVAIVVSRGHVKNVIPEVHM